MLQIHSEPDKRDPLQSHGPALLALGFRPMFSLAGLAAVILIFAWLPMLTGRLTPPPYYGLFLWHSHEMLFGFTSAVIAGFLLTAVRNWTGVNTLTGRPLASLALLWLAGRVVPFASGWLPGWSIALVDLLFLPAVAMAIQPALWQGEQKINRIFVPLLLLMAVTNLLVHLQVAGIAMTGTMGIDVMLLMVALLVSLLAGRVIPFFTQSVIPNFQATRRNWLEQSTMLLFALLIILQLIPANATTAIAIVATLLALAQVLRVVGWHHTGVWRIPILWVLYTGLLWMIVGFVMLGLSQFDLVGANSARHALGLGCVGLLTLGMMARVSLGHTGRDIKPVRSMEVAFVLLNLAAFCRVFGPLLPVGNYIFWVHLSAGLWIICFLVFCRIYLPILTRPRIDGKPG